MKKKVISMILAAAMVLSIGVFMVFAEEPAVQFTPLTAEEYNAISGNLESVPIENAVSSDRGGVLENRVIIGDGYARKSDPIKPCDRLTAICLTAERIRGGKCCRYLYITLTEYGKSSERFITVNNHKIYLNTPISTTGGTNGQQYVAKYVYRVELRKCQWRKRIFVTAESKNACEPFNTLCQWICLPRIGCCY